ncbi:MAG: branched-chain amino acid ABC transporter permease [Pseudonocardiales bacterium]|nr:MAG: branched-chain amino acid ABC transporter permease [Pseudonocardiales bacterium]
MQQVVNGLALGSQYALFAVGFTLVLGVLDVLNLSHVAVFTAGAYVTYLMSSHGVPIVLAIAIAVVACSGLGILVERIGFRPLRGRSNEGISALVSGVAVALILEAIILAKFGPNALNFGRKTYPTAPVQLASDVLITPLQLVTIGSAIGLTVLLQWTLKFTTFGRQVRAVAENAEAAALLGVRVQSVYIWTFAIASASGAFAGALFAMQFNGLTPDLGDSVQLKGLAAIILGGMGSISGSLCAGIMLGFVEVLTVQFVGSQWKDLAAFLVLFVVLLVRPRGLLGLPTVRQA